MSLNPSSPDRFTGFTDSELVKELARRKEESIKLERKQRDIRSNFLFECLDELCMLVVQERPEDARLIKFLREVNSDKYWDSDYDVELRLVKYPPLD